MIIHKENLQDMFVELNKFIIENPSHRVPTRIGLANEILGVQIVSTSTMDYKFTNPNINRIKYDYAEQFWNFMISGGTDAETAFKDYPGVAKFIAKPKNSELPDNFNTLYGPRIVNQYDRLIAELKNPNSRRGTILILSENDQQLLQKDETIEYPCTIAFNFTVRDNKVYFDAIMRSQNTAVVLQLDIYLQVKLLHKVAVDLGLKPEDTRYSAFLINAHVFDRDIDYVKGFING